MEADKDTDVSLKGRDILEVGTRRKPKQFISINCHFLIVKITFVHEPNIEGEPKIRRRGVGSEPEACRLVLSESEEGCEGDQVNNMMLL